MRWTVMVIFLFVVSARAEVVENNREVVEQQILAASDRIDRLKTRIDEMQSLLESLEQNQTTFAGYGSPQVTEDAARVRQALYRMKAEYADQVAKRLYLQHSLQSAHATDGMQGAQQEGLVEPEPTSNPENCPQGVIHFKGRWHCLKSQIERAPAHTQQPRCELGEIEMGGTRHCVGHEPGGALVSPASMDFLSALLPDVPVEEEREVPSDVYRQLRMK